MRVLRLSASVLLMALGFLDLGRGEEAAADLAARVAERVRDWQPTSDERRLDQVGWARDLLEARRLAKEHRRPLFVFTYDGSPTRAHAITLQRC